VTGSPNTLPPGWAGAWVSSLLEEEVRSFTCVRSHEVNRVFRLDCDEQSLFLKVGPGLQREYEKLQWLEGRLPCPRPVGFTAHAEADALLTSALNGEDLAQLSASLPPQVVFSRLATALLRLHATNITDWPFGMTNEGKGNQNKVLVHGDACLPNFLYHDGHLSGYIDVGDMTVGEPEVDLAAAVWSLQYNLGPGHGLAFLHAYGMREADEARVEALRQKYELG
jgi:kanamycin kinase